jgi:hypothetical protein
MQASKLPTVPESQAPIDNGQFRKRPNSIAVFRPQEPDTHLLITAIAMATMTSQHSGYFMFNSLTTVPITSHYDIIFLI